MRFQRPARVLLIATAIFTAVATTPSIGWSTTGVSVMYGADSASQNLLAIDPATAAPTVIGPFGPLVLGSIAWDRESGQLYGTDTNAAGQLYRLDPATGTPTLVGNTGVGFLHGIAFHPYTGVLYAIDINSTLYTIDKVTAVPTTIGPVGFPIINALDFDPTTGILYGAQGGPPMPGILITIDVTTGAGTLVGPTHRINGLAFDASGALFASENGFTPGNPCVLYSVDKYTGAWSLIGTINTGNVLGLTFSEIYPSTPFCSGDGSGTPCPCGNSGAVRNGCANSVNPSGAHLTTSGVPSLSADSLTLVGTGMPASFALYFQGTTQVNGGLGAPFGDGLRCVGGNTVRLKTVANDAGGASHFPQAGDPSVSVRGLVTVAGSRMYQVWYRNAAAFCTAQTFNLTNGVQVSWVN